VSGFLQLRLIVIGALVGAVIGALTLLPRDMRTARSPLIALTPAAVATLAPRIADTLGRDGLGRARNDTGHRATYACRSHVIDTAPRGDTATHCS